MEVFKIIYSVLGGLGIFFFGMKSMSEALQSVAGDLVRKTIATITKHRVYSVLVGTIVTVIVQSSSVTTVMVVGFVNAGLMNLTQAIGVIFGANIGTTITGWIISIKVGKYGLLFIGLGIFPLLFGKTNKWRQIGKVMFGVGMIFFGLDIMSNAFKPLRSMPEFLDMIAYFNGQNYGSYLACIAVGCILTMIIQSSSAMLGITMALATTGVIQFHTAAALVLGENIGTTITALLAAVGGNVSAKRAGYAHAIFNLLGVMIVFTIFPLYIKMIDFFVPGDPNFVDAAGEIPNIAVHIASGHTIFNVTATLLFLPFIHNLARLVTKLVPERKKKEQYHLVMLGEPRDMIPATALAQAQAEVKKMNEIVSRMYEMTKDIFLEKGTMSHGEAVSKSKDYEKITDNIQKEVTVFIVKLMESPLSAQESRLATSLLKESDELESIADYLDRLCSYSLRTPLDQILVKESKEEFLNYFKEVQDYYDSISKDIQSDEKIDMSIVYRESETLRARAETLRSTHLERVSRGEYSALTALTYSDMVVALRKIRSHTQNLAEAYAY